MKVRNLLLRAYPRSWREEYGEELAGVLARRGLTFAVVADVLGGAARQHLDRDEPWKICGVGLALWFMMARLVAVFFPYRTFFLWCWFCGLLITLASGAWTATRSKSGTLRSTVASAKTALIGQAGVVVLYLLVLPRENAYSFQGHGIYYWFLKTLALGLALSVPFGFAGALLGRLFTRLRKEPRAACLSGP
jgi:hypothetical protein